MTKIAKHYPGPRPLQMSQSSLLVGREGDIGRLRYAILNRQLVNVTAPSGTGKSSLLTAGLAPTLKDHKVVMLRSWAEVSGDDPLAYLYSALRQAFKDSNEEPEIGRDWPDDPPEGLTLLARRYGIFQEGETPRLLVAVLDQVEELMRLAPEAAQLLLTGVAYAVRQLPFKLVLSLRTEFKEQLAPLESKLPPRLWQGIRIDSLPPDQEVSVISRPLEVAHDSGEAAWQLAPSVGQNIADTWARAQAETTGLGLLHLQAIMWVIEHEAAPLPSEEIDATSLKARSAFYRELCGAQESKNAKEVVVSALKRYLDYSLQELSDQMEDPHAAGETRNVIARFVGGLSAAGYKVTKSSDELFNAAFDGLARMRWDKKIVKELRREWEDPENRRTGQDELREAAARLGITDASFGGDRSMLAGRLAETDRLSAFCAMSEVFERALTWLQAAGVVRITRDPDQRRLISIIHDGYGVALNQWADSVVGHNDGEFFLQVLTGESGNAVLTGMTVRSRLVEGLRWPGCSIEDATFQDVTLRACDLRGALFYNCRFENVRFEGCYGPGLLFIKPTIAGSEGLTIKDSVTRTLTVTFATVESGSAGITFEGINQQVAEQNALMIGEDRTPGVDGLFIDEHQGPWTVRDSRFRHLLVSGLPNDPGAGPGVIERSEITLIHLDGQIRPVLCKASRLRYLDYGEHRDRVMTEDGSEF